MTKTKFGYPCISMDVCGYPWIIMDTHGNNNRYPSLMHGYMWRSMGPWVYTWNLWIQENLGNQCGVSLNKCGTSLLSVWVKCGISLGCCSGRCCRCRRHCLCGGHCEGLLLSRLWQKTRLLTERAPLAKLCEKTLNKNWKIEKLQEIVHISCLDSK